ncbi:MAG TPA: type II toxin-antitoxin system HicA family toxin [Candidatus Babeliales bacterium]|nr:type II toxin-antitoxin system HicA family toxin [Candidatus Babeliales bacterium]
MNKKQRKTLETIFKLPVPADIKWSDIEALFLGLNGDVTEGNGSRVRVELNGVKAVFHRPHPRKETDKGAVVSVRKFLINAGVNYDEI